MEKMTKKAYVEEIDGDMAVLKIKRECACQNKYSCDVNVKCFSLQEETIIIAIKNNVGAKTGDFVEVESKASSILLYAAVVFLLPLIVGLSVYFIALKFTANEIMPYILSGVSFIASIVFLYYFLNKIVKGREDFVIGRIL
jgi:sigma-E factor negative regulatory protein RseC